MSTKIYDAYRVKPGVDIWQLVAEIRTRAEAIARAGLRDFYIRACVADRRPPDEEGAEKPDRLRAWADYIRNALVEKKRRLADESTKLSLVDVADFVYQEYRAQLTSYERNSFNLDANFVVYEHEGLFYLRLYSDRCSILGDVLDFVPDMPELEDYHYQNQSDWPDGMTAPEWDERRRVWEGILTEDGHWGPKQLLAEIVSDTASPTSSTT